MMSTATYGAAGAGATGIKDLSMQIFVPAATRICGMQKPKGGWAGPFGFLRLVAIAFVFLFLYACVALAYHITLDDVLAIVLDAYLAVASLFCALCAWSHEKLENQATEANQQNKRFSKNLGKFAKAIEGLEGCNTELKDLARKFGKNVDEVEHILDRMAYYSDIDSVCDLLARFMMADAGYGGNTDRVCDGEDLLDFLEGVSLAISKVPGLSRLEINDIYERNRNVGIDIGMVKLLANAMICNHHEPERAEALRDLFLFCMEPNDERMSNLEEQKNLFKYCTMPQGSLGQALRDLQKKTGANAPCVSHKNLLPLAQVFIFDQLHTKKADVKRTISLDSRENRENRELRTAGTLGTMSSAPSTAASVSHAPRGADAV